MRLSSTIVRGLPFLLMLQGCSSHLSRHEAGTKIDAMMRNQPVGEYKIYTISGNVPTYGLPSSEFNDESIDIGRIGIDPDLPEFGVSLLNALAKVGYLTIKDAGPGDAAHHSETKHYDSTRLIDLTSKIGRIVAKTKDNETYDTGFVCFPVPNPHACVLPDFIDRELKYDITGITEDGIHAKVNLLMDWKLSRIALELKPYARPSEGETERRYHLDSWEEFLNSHPVAGSTQATILFQRFDDGWRIVDENGKSEKDFNPVIN